MLDAGIKPSRAPPSVSRSWLRVLCQSNPIKGLSVDLAPDAVEDGAMSATTSEDFAAALAGFN